jgi:hypothetical protein
MALPDEARADTGEVLTTERDHIVALANSLSLSAPTWSLAGNTNDQMTAIIDIVSQASGMGLAIVPHILLHDSAACDTGGVLRDIINTVFDHLLRRANLFELDEDTDPPRYAFPTFSRTLLHAKKRSYQVFGKLLYWFVIIHKQIPFPNDLHPSIFSYSVYGYIPMSLTQSLNASVYEMAMKIQSLNNVDTLRSIPMDVGTWLQQFPDISTRTVLNNLKDLDQGPSVVACQLATNAIIGWHTDQYNWVREGFLSVPDGYSSVSFYS